MRVDEMPLSQTAKEKLGALTALERNAVDEGFEGFLKSEGEIVLALSSTQRLRKGFRTFELSVVLVGEVIFVLCDDPKGKVGILDIWLIAEIHPVFH